MGFIIKYNIFVSILLHVLGTDLPGTLARVILTSLSNHLNSVCTPPAVAAISLGAENAENCQPSIYGFAGFFPFRHVYLVCIQMHPLPFFTKSKYSLTSHIASDMNTPTSSILPNNLKLRLSSSLYFFYMNSQVSQSHCCLVPPKREL